MNRRFDFDPTLPALSFAFDLDAVTRSFAARWRSDGMAVSFPRSISTCRLLNTRYEPARRCVATYQLMADHAPPHLTIGVVEITPAGCAQRFFYDDPQLPGLVSAIDPIVMRERIAVVLEDVGADDGPDACAITPIRYKPGAHCLLRYDIQTRSGQHSFYGKLFARRSERLVATIDLLHQSSMAIPDMPLIPRPLAYWPELRLLLQPAVAGRDLHAAAFDEATDHVLRERWICAAGRGLAALHKTVSVDGPARTFEDDLHELATYRAPLAVVSPTLATSFDQAMTELAVLARRRREPAFVASHGAFRTDQLLIAVGRLAMIDLDSFCRANPARDLGNFVAYLDWKALRQPQHAHFIERASHAFLEGYAAVQSELDTSWLALYRAASLLKIAGRRFRALSYGEWPLVPDLIDAAHATLRTA